MAGIAIGGFARRPICLKRFPAKACPALDAGWIPLHEENASNWRNRTSVPITPKRIAL
jgi:hypothetical protein